MFIERKALQTLLYTMLTCPCPVEAKYEKAIVKEFLSSGNDDPLDYGQFLAIADENPAPTPLHLFLRFLADGKEHPLEDDIVFADVLRYFGGHYHWERSVQSFDPLSMRSSASYLVGHMFLPVTLVPDRGGRQAAWETPELSVVFDETLLFPGLEAAGNIFYVLHLGGIVAAISLEEADILNKHALLLKEMLRIARETPEINCAEFYFGRDHRETTLSRLRRNDLL